MEAIRETNDQKTTTNIHMNTDNRNNKKIIDDNEKKEVK